jgi:hypothetical protein
MCVGIVSLFPNARAADVDDSRNSPLHVALGETYNAVTGVYFTNISVHKGSHKPGLVERRFRADVKYWLMDAKYYERGELSIGNPPLVDLVRRLGSKDLPETEPTTLYLHGLRDRSGNHSTT